jgi:putative FmdB family regulatory protein
MYAVAMPLYDFRCKSCDHEFEALVRTGDVPVCPSCKGQDLERLLSTFAVDSAERRQAAAKDSRRRQIAGRRDALIADEEYRQKHDKE